MSEVLIVDLDGTLCGHPDAEKITEETWNEDTFAEIVPRMYINPVLADLLNGTSYKVVMLTARPVRLWETTAAWLREHLDGITSQLICSSPEDESKFELARKRGGYEALKQAHANFKLDTIRKIDATHRRVVGVFEDNEKTIALLRKNGYQVFGAKFSAKQVS